MNTFLASGSRQGRGVTLLALYEGLEAGIEVQRSIDRLVANLGGDKVDVRIWRFDMLRDPQMAAHAGAEARGADVLLIATDQHDTIPDPVAHWLKAVVDHLDARGACVAHIKVNGKPRHENPTADYLARLARRHGHAFFNTVRSRPEINS